MGLLLAATGTSNCTLIETERPHFEEKLERLLMQRWTSCTPPPAMARSARSPA
jgi:hypothetical protein